MSNEDKFWQTDVAHKAGFVRKLCLVLGYRIPTDWTDEQLMQFMRQLATSERPVYH